MLFSLKKITGYKSIKPFHFLSKILFFLIWLPIFIGFTYPEHPEFSGVMGFEINDFLTSFIGKIGVGLCLFISFVIYIMVRYNLTWDNFIAWQEKRRELLRLEKEEEAKERLEQEKIELAKREKEKAEALKRKIEEERLRIVKAEEELLNKFNSEVEHQQKIVEEEEEIILQVEKNQEVEEPIQLAIQPQATEDAFEIEVELPEEAVTQSINLDHSYEEDLTDDDEISADDFVFRIAEEEETIEILEPEVTEIIPEGPDFVVEKVTEEETVEEASARLIKEQGEYDSRKDLPNYQFPTLNLLKKYEGGNNTIIDQRELEQNKNRILETLNNYGIKINPFKLHQLDT